MSSPTTWRSSFQINTAEAAAEYPVEESVAQTSVAEVEGEPTVGAATPLTDVDLDDSPPISYSEDEWQALETHMAAYFNSDTDILAQSVPGQRFVGKWRFVAKYLQAIDKKFPYKADKNVRGRMDGFFQKLDESAENLLRWRVGWLVASLGVLYLCALSFSWRERPPASPQASAGAGQLERLTQAAADANLVSTDVLFLVVVFFVCIASFQAWWARTESTQRANLNLQNEFQAFYQFTKVFPLHGRYMATRNDIAITSPRPKDAKEEELQAIVLKIERLVKNMVWTAKRVEYYEKRFEVSYWLMMHRHMQLNAAQIGLFAGLIFAYLWGVTLIVGPSFSLNVVGVDIPLQLFLWELGVIVALGSILLSEFKPVDDSKAVKQGLRVGDWTRFSAFNLHGELANVVGDQIRRIHQEEGKHK